MVPDRPLFCARSTPYDRICDDERARCDPGAKRNAASRASGRRGADGPFRLEFHPDGSGALVTSATHPDQRVDGRLRRDVARSALSRLALVAYPGRYPHSGRVRHDCLHETTPDPA